MYPDNRSLLVSIDDIKAFGVIDINVHEHVLQPIAMYVQDEVIHNLIGTRLYEKLMELVETDEIDLDENECYKQLLRGYIFKIMAWKIKAESCLDLSEKVRNFGVGRVSDDRVYPDTYNDMQKTKRNFHDRADKYVVELGNFLSCNCNCFPELKEHTKWWEKPANPDSGTHTYIYFPSNRKCGC